jgi:cytochrome c553
MNYKLFLLVVAVTLMTTGTSVAGDASALYKKKCSSCHGASGEGKPAVKAPALKGSPLDASQIVQKVTKGSPESKPPHNKGMSGLSEEDTTALADYVKSLK